MEGFEIDTDPARLDLDVIHGFLSVHSYWAVGRPRAVVEKAIRNSLNFGLFMVPGRSGSREW